MSPRVQLARAAPPPVRENSVFINGPYDNEFKPRFDALVLAIMCCGFTPRCAMEDDSHAKDRMDRITATLRGSKYSVHDLSRCTGEGDANLGRFNMPFELGIAVAAKSLRGKQGDHEYRVLVPKDYPYPRYLSDLQGRDLATYDGTAADLAVAVIQWLKQVPDAVFEPDRDRVRATLKTHHRAANECRRSSRNHSYWRDLLRTTFAVAQQARLIPRTGP